MVLAPRTNWPPAGVSDGNSTFYAELVLRPRFALADALHLRRVQGVEFALVLRLLGGEAAHPLKNGGEAGILGHIRPFDLAVDIAQKPTDPGAHLAKMPHTLGMSACMEKTGHFLARLSAQSKIGLAQPDAGLGSRPVQPLDRPHQEMTVGRMGDGLGLHSRVDRHSLDLALADRSDRQGYTDGLGQEFLQLVGSNPLAPARH